MKPFIVCLVALTALGCSSAVEPTPAPPEVASPARWAKLTKTCDESSPAYSLPTALRPTNSASVYPYNLPPDAYVAVTNPGGWGGRAFLDGGQYYMYFVDTTRTQEVFADLRRRQALGSENINLLKGRWDYAQLWDWNSYLRDKALEKIGGDTYIEVPLNRLHVSVASEDARTKLDSVLSVLDFPCFLAAIAVEPQYTGRLHGG
jgi:hypothetical protein